MPPKETLLSLHFFNSQATRKKWAMRNITSKYKIPIGESHLSEVFFLQELVSFYTWDYMSDLKIFPNSLSSSTCTLLYITHFTVLQIQIHSFTLQGDAEASRFSTREAQHNCDSLTPRAEFEPHC